jgi:hypothetical protein
VKFAVRCFLVLLLLLTLGWKLAVRPIDPNKTRDAIVEFLARHGFNVATTQPVILQIPVAVDARSSACKLVVGIISPYGFNIDFFRHLSGATDRMFFVFRGMVYKQQPVLLTSVTHLTFKLLHNVGLVSGIPPVLAVLSPCDAEQLPWAELPF